MAMTSLAEQCRRIQEALAAKNRQLVLAESCTAGLVAASLGRVPGISNNLCGSAVTYRDNTKAAWLRVPQELLRDPGAVSSAVARAMAEGALSVTPEADLAASITGHLGPGAPAGFDGVVFIGLAQRSGEQQTTEVHRVQLTAGSRVRRQREAAREVLARLGEFLSR